MTYDTYENDVPYEAQTSFEGECTCEHGADEHGWGSCDAVIELPDKICGCGAGWVE